MFVITGGHVHDSQVVDAFLDWAVSPLAIVADKAYGGATIRQGIADEDAVAVIPPKSKAQNAIPHDANLYAMRNIVEQFFCRIEDMRRFATASKNSDRTFSP